MSKFHSTFIFSLASIVVLISSCQLYSSINFHESEDTHKMSLYEYLHISSCTAACWNNIQPGVTTRDEVDQIIASSTGIEIVAIGRGRSFYGLTIDNPPAFIPSTEQMIQIYFNEDNIVTLIGIVVDICIQDALSDLPMPEIGLLPLSIIYPDLGILYSLMEEEGKVIGVTIYASENLIELYPDDRKGEFSTYKNILLQQGCVTNLTRN